MKSVRIVASILGLALISLMIGCASTESGSDNKSSAEPPPQPDLLRMIELTQAVHFRSPDGTDLTLGPGIYAVEVGDEKSLIVTAVKGETSARIEAEPGQHEEKLEKPLASAVKQGEDIYHIALLLPDGKMLDAVGTSTGVRTRGMAKIQSPMLAQAIVRPQAQLLVKPQPQQQQTRPTPSATLPSSTLLVLPAPVGVYTIPLWGWADLHTHPMSNLAFGGKFFHGGVDVGSLLPAVQMPYDPRCRFDVRANSMEEALSDDAPTHGDNFQSICGDAFRKSVIGLAETSHGFHGPQPGHRLGAPIFDAWPKWNDITHQKMWVEWIRRAKDGGLRVMVALSHNSRFLGESVIGGACGAAPLTCATDDVHSSDLQITEMKAFVLRHPDLMEVALTASDVYRIVRSNRIAIVLGVEIDNIGNFNQLPPWVLQQPGFIEAEIQRLYTQGVRYIFPIHLTDNVFGDTAIYDPMFNVSNIRETGSAWTVECATPPAPPFPGDDIGFILPGSSPLGDFLLRSFPNARLPIPPTCPLSGHRNGRTPNGLTGFGEIAIRAMMKRGMIIDIDHMSHKAAERALQIAEGIPGGGFPLMSGHTGIRAQNGQFNSENHRTRTQLRRIACLQGMFGLGTSEADAYDWATQYVDAFNEMSKAFDPTSPCPTKVSFGPGIVAFGTDMNSLVASARPTMGPDLKPGAPIRFGLYNTPGFPTVQSSSRGKVWDYNAEGVAHYGMLADFVKDVRSAPVNHGISGPDLVDNHLFRSADYFWHMWQKIEAQKSRVP